MNRIDPGCSTMVPNHAPSLSVILSFANEEEVLPEACEAIAAVALDESGAESLLVGGQGKVWRYALAGGG